jgi:class 3 adenylate cyclase
MSALPSGTVTFLFTHLEGSTRLMRELGDGWPEVHAHHRRLLREAFDRHGGREIDVQGDAFFAAFARAREGVNAAASAEEQDSILRDVERSLAGRRRPHSPSVPALVFVGTVVALFCATIVLIVYLVVR